MRKRKKKVEKILVRIIVDLNIGGKIVKKGTILKLKDYKGLEPFIEVL